MTIEAEHEAAYETAVAIIGMAGRFPGAPNVATFWDNIAAGVRSIRHFTDEELLAAGVEPAMMQQPNYVKAGTVIDGVDQFDATFFGYPPREAEVMDPQHRLFLECAWEALEQAAYAPDTHPGLIGIFAGSGFGTYLANNIATHPEIKEAVGSLQLAVGNERDSLASTVSYKLNLQGPSVAVQSFCSTSLVAVHLACQSLLTYEADITIAGGVALEFPHGTGYLYDEGGILSPDGYCRTFDAQAQGSVMGNGLGVVVLKRMEEARTDGDHIYAVIRGSALNNDGLRKVGYTAPGLVGQTSVILRALDNAGVEPDTVSYIEAHGTATPLGDAVELAAMIKAFQRSTSKQQFCAIGSVKPNIGHLDRASGVTGLIKTALALTHRQLPPSLDFTAPTPDLDLDHSPFYVNTTLTPWPASLTPRRAGVNSFGLGGTNVHVILEEAPSPAPTSPAHSEHLLLLSAKTASALETLTDNLVAHCRQHPELRLADVAYTLQVGRSAFNHRRVVVAGDLADAGATLARRDSQRVLTINQTNRDRPVALLLGGVGEHYPGMAQALYQHEPTFRQAVDHCNSLVQPLLGQDLRALLYPSPSTPPAAGGGRPQLGRNGHTSELGPLQQTALAQPAVFVVEYALAQLLQSWGIRPTALLGYSLGEYVAACLAGVLSLSDALRLVATRAQLIQTLPPGAMLAVALAEADVTPYLSAEVALAAVNGPTTCVLAGTSTAIAEVAQQLTAQEIACRAVATTHAFHSPLLQPIADQLTAVARTLTFHPPQLPYLSNVTGTWITDQQATDPTYWAQHLCKPVRFSDGIAELLQRGEQVLLEVGAGQALGSFVKQHPACSRERNGMVYATLPAMYESQLDRAFLLTTLGKLWLAGVTIDWTAFHDHQQRRRVPLPTYPFERQRFWIAPNSSPHQAQAPTQPTRKQADITDWFYAPVWRQSIPLDSPQPHAVPQQPSLCVVFLDEDSLGPALAEQLAAHKWTVVTVRRSDSFKKYHTNEYSIRPDQPDDYARLFSMLGQPPATVVHLWSLVQQPGRISSVEIFDQAQQLGLYSLLYLVKALSKHLTTADLNLWVATCGAHQVTGVEDLCPEHGTLAGACIVIAQESLNITCHQIDVDRPVHGSWQEQRLLGYLVHEIITRSPDLMIAYRAQQRWLRGFEAVHLNPPTTSPLRYHGVYLITGGLGAIGLTLAAHLATTVQARLVLTTHSSFPVKAEWSAWLAAHPASDPVSNKIQLLQSLEVCGATLLLVTADVADEAQMYHALQQAQACFGTLNGVIYTAGTSHSDGFAPIQDMTQAGCELHFVPKVRGLYVLEKVLQDQKLDFCILFSSLASILGGLGFIGYSAANSFMDAFVHKHNLSSPQPWVSVDWDTWQTKANPHGDLGMTVLEYAMEKAEAIQAFERIAGMGMAVPQLINSTGNLQNRFDQWVRLLSSRSTDEVKADLHPRPELITSYSPPANETEQIIADIWQTVLGSEVGIHDNFFELGGNSLIGTQVITRLRRAFQLNVPLVLAFEAPTVAGMAVAIEILLIDEIEQLGEEEVVRLSQAGSELAIGG